MALDYGFRAFDTAEAEYWYDQKNVGRALRDYFTTRQEDDECLDEHGRVCGMTCHSEDLRISTKIPPWSLTSHYDIRQHAASSRKELVGFCEHKVVETNQDDGEEEEELILPFPLDVYYIHAPACWDGWHPRCNNPPRTLPLKDAWMAMEAVVGLDRTAQRIGLSNVHPQELRQLIAWIQQRQDAYNKIQSSNPSSSTMDDGTVAPPRMPDVLQDYADPLEPSNELRQICKEHGIEFVSYSTLGTQHAMRNGNNPVLGSQVVQTLAAKHQRSTAEVVLQWARQLGMSVIPRSSKRTHIQELARLLDSNPSPKFQLSDEDMKQIETLQTRASH
mmetsp:Transcript_2804/g.6091  ORF Transcript_2804/g.6091 Transcript_2804/m.6091 type:complete len:332 (-) Transcript_2804:1278-2273(-)